MRPDLALKSINRLSPGTMLDIGARNCKLSKIFAEEGYQVEAIDPWPVEPLKLINGVSFKKTSLELYEAEKEFDLVIASRISHLVKYDVYNFLIKLKSLTKRNGLIYVTLLGNEDGWADNPKIKALDFSKACALIEKAGLVRCYSAVEWFEGEGYDGTSKSWHWFTFVLAQS